MRARRPRPLTQPVNAFCEVRRSVIHGQGVFARRALRAGTRLLEYRGERITKAESNRRGLAQHAWAERTGGAAVYIFELNDREDIDGNKPYNPARLINHSCAPNCEVFNEDDRLYIYAKVAIARGVELTFDYGYDIAHYADHPCRCGAPGCVGYIVQAEQRPLLLERLARFRPQSA